MLFRSQFCLPTVFIEPIFCNTTKEKKLLKETAEQILSDCLDAFGAPHFLIRAEDFLSSFTPDQVAISQYMINDLGHYLIAEKLYGLIRYL